MSLHWQKIIEDEQTIIMTKCLLTNTLELIVSIHNCSAVFLLLRAEVKVLLLLKPFLN